jgi:hypothetical protein
VARCLPAVTGAGAVCATVSGISYCKEIVARVPGNVEAMDVSLIGTY